jgi:hypothetical protein
MDWRLMVNRHNNYDQRKNGIALPPGMNGAQLVQLDLKAHGGPHAQPVSLALPVNGGMELHTWGGFSKLEAAAIQLAAGLCVANAWEPGELGKRAAAAAEEVLVACSELVQQRMGEAKDASQ